MTKLVDGLFRDSMLSQGGGSVGHGTFPKVSQHLDH